MAIAKNVKSTTVQPKRRGGVRETQLREVNDWTVYYSAPHPPRNIPFPIWQLQRWQSNEFPLFREGDPKTINFDPAQHLNLKFEKHLAMAQEAAHSEVSVRVHRAKTDGG